MCADISNLPYTWKAGCRPCSNGSSNLCNYAEGGPLNGELSQNVWYCRPIPFKVEIFNCNGSMNCSGCCRTNTFMDVNYTQTRCTLESQTFYCQFDPAVIINGNSNLNPLWISIGIIIGLCIIALLGLLVWKKIINKARQVGPEPQLQNRIQISRIALNIQEAMPQCSICTEQINRRRNYTMTKCGHQFHGGCLREWLRLHDSCPNCRVIL